MIDKETKEMILYALELGLWSAKEQLHYAKHDLQHGGYQKYTNEQLDCNVVAINDAIEMVEKL